MQSFENNHILLYLSIWKYDKAMVFFENWKWKNVRTKSDRLSHVDISSSFFLFLSSSASLSCCAGKTQSFTSAEWDWRILGITPVWQRTQWAGKTPPATSASKAVSTQILFIPEWLLWSDRRISLKNNKKWNSLAQYRGGTVARVFLVVARWMLSNPNQQSLKQRQWYSDLQMTGTHRCPSCRIVQPVLLSARQNRCAIVIVTHLCLTRRVIRGIISVCRTMDVGELGTKA